MSLEKLSQSLKDFADARDWEQFHSPKNLCMALSGEVGELIEHFQWLSEKESYDPQDLKGVQEELADCLLYLLRLSSQLNIDLEQAAFEKIKLNAKKYPVEKFKGSCKKYRK